MSHETLGAGANGLTVPAFQVRDDHRGLLVGLDRSAAAVGGPVEAGLVAVPATRRRRHALHTAVEVAGDLGWPLLVLCSHGLQPSQVRERVRRIRPDVRVVAATVGRDDGLHAHRPWRCGQHSEAGRRTDVDTNRKRNLALAAAVVTELERVLFVDDDVVDLGVHDVLAGLAHMRGHRDHLAVSWPLTCFPDNSVVHHARRDYLGRSRLLRRRRGAAGPSRRGRAARIPACLQRGLAVPLRRPGAGSRRARARRRAAARRRLPAGPRRVRGVR